MGSSENQREKKVDKEQIPRNKHNNLIIAITNDKQKAC